METEWDDGLEYVLLYPEDGEVGILISDLAEGFEDPSQEIDGKALLREMEMDYEGYTESVTEQGYWYFRAFEPNMKLYMYCVHCDSTVCFMVVEEKYDADGAALVNSVHRFSGTAALPAASETAMTVKELPSFTYEVPSGWTDTVLGAKTAEGYIYNNSEGGFKRAFAMEEDFTGVPGRDLISDEYFLRALAGGWMGTGFYSGGTFSTVNGLLMLRFQDADSNDICIYCSGDTALLVICNEYTDSAVREAVFGSVKAK